jgi:hypothetical protein
MAWVLREWYKFLAYSKIDCGKAVLDRKNRLDR